jgi:hypothetical protein
MGISIGIVTSAQAQQGTRKVYGKDLTDEQILLGKGVRTNATVDTFMKTLEKVSPAHVHTKKES